MEASAKNLTVRAGRITCIDVEIADPTGEHIALNIGAGRAPEFPEIPVALFHTFEKFALSSI